jgi:hypothetical protein
MLSYSVLFLSTDKHASVYRRGAQDIWSLYYFLQIDVHSAPALPQHAEFHVGLKFMERYKNLFSFIWQPKFKLYPFMPSSFRCRCYFLLTVQFSFRKMFEFWMQCPDHLSCVSVRHHKVTREFCTPCVFSRAVLLSSALSASRSDVNAAFWCQWSVMSFRLADLRLPTWTNWKG